MERTALTTRARALALLSVALVLSMTTWFSASAVLPELRADWALSDSAAAWLTIAVQLGFAAGAVASSVVNLSDLVSPRLLILAGTVGAAAANALLVTADGARSAIPLRFATGVFRRLHAHRRHDLWLVPFLEDAVDWRYAFAFLAPGPALGIVATLRLRALQASSSSRRNDPPPIVRSA